jgi:hypothetical protein
VDVKKTVFDEKNWAELVVVRWLRSERATFFTMEGLLHKPATSGIYMQYTRRYSSLNLNYIKTRSSGIIYYAYVPLDRSFYMASLSRAIIY